jgi:hypothetical protein
VSQSKNTPEQSEKVQRIGIRRQDGIEKCIGNLQPGSYGYGNLGGSEWSIYYHEM